MFGSAAGAGDLAGMSEHELGSRCNHFRVFSRYCTPFPHTADLFPVSGLNMQFYCVHVPAHLCTNQPNGSFHFYAQPVPELHVHIFP